MNLHVLYNGGDGTYDVVNIKEDGGIEYVSTEFMDGDHATTYIAGWHDGREAKDDHRTAEVYNAVQVKDSTAVDNLVFNLRHMQRGSLAKGGPIDPTPIHDEIQESLNRRAD